VLYQELEKSTVLQQRIVELEQQNRRLAQNARIQENQLLLAAKTASLHRMSHEEVAALKERASLGKCVIAELDIANKTIAALEEHLRLAANGLQDKNEELNRWKSKLKGLMEE
jgi:hypothetical protein